MLRCGLHSAPGCLRFTFYPAMPGNSTAAPAEKWEHQRPAMAALMGSAMADACFQGAATWVQRGLHDSVMQQFDWLGQGFCFLCARLKSLRASLLALLAGRASNAHSCMPPAVW